MNGVLVCACGCDTLITATDKKGRRHFFLPGHQNIGRDKHTTNTEPPIRKCKTCGATKDISSFGTHTYKAANGSAYNRHIHKCKACVIDYNNAKRSGTVSGISYNEWRKAYRQLQHQTINGFVRQKIHDFRRVNTGIQCNLSASYLENLFYEQQGRCYYTGRELSISSLDMSQKLSLDRLNPKGGYVVGNVVWCSYLVNTMKQNLDEPSFYEFIEKILAVRNARL